MIVLAVLITCQMIFVRSILNESTIWQTEAVVYLMVGATLLGLPYVQRLRGHVSVDLLPMLLSPAKIIDCPDPDRQHHRDWHHAVLWL